MTWRERLFGIQHLDDGVRLVRLEPADVRNLLALKDALGMSAPEAAGHAIKEALERVNASSVSQQETPTDNT